jgi:hypothetical protein
MREKEPDLDITFRFDYYGIPAPHPQRLIDIIISNGFTFYFKDYVRDWDTLHGFISLGVSDMMIVEELGFDLIKVSGVAWEHDIQIRVMPNVAQSSWNQTPALKKFFIRPEDVDIYESYVDVFEFFGQKDKQDTYYRIYEIDKKWFGDLSEVIISFDEHLDSRYLLPSFANRRASCGKRCLKGYPCQICEANADLAKVLEENNLLIKTLES